MRNVLSRAHSVYGRVSFYGTGACCKRCALRNARCCKLSKLFFSCNLLIKGFGNAIDRDACIGIAQRSGGDGVRFSMVWRWFNKVWLEQGVARKSWG